MIALNNSLTSLACRLKRWRIVTGLAEFYLAGLAALFGTLFSSVWNYGITSLFF